MENFFDDDKFHSDLDSLLCDMDIHDMEGLDQIEDGWSLKVEESTLEPMIKVDAKYLKELLIDCNEHRLHDDFDNRDEEKILNAITQSVDFGKMGLLMPKLYYPKGVFVTITKKDLIEYLK